MTPFEKAASLQARKNKGPALATITAYDYPSARLVDEAGMDLILVGDSLGMVVLGYPDTTHVTMAHMLHHVAAAARGTKSALLVGDLPIDSYRDTEEARRNAAALVEAGAEAVKLEGGIRQAEKVAAIVNDGIPVLGHHGMLPQRVLSEGGYKKKGKTEEEATAIEEGCLALQDAGCFAIVLESIIPRLARALTSRLAIPTIGIGCGNHTCDGEIAVISDVIGSYPWFVPPFATQRATVADDISSAISDYIAACKNQE